MLVSNPRKTVSASVLDCNDTATVTISFDAVAALTQNPADIILLMDRSGSMLQERMTAAKQAAEELIRMIADATSGDGSIGGGSRMGIASFSNTATEDVPLTGNTARLTTAIAALTSGGLTNHEAAFETAERMLDPASANRQIVVIFTDGETTAGGSADPITARMKASGTEIFCIGLVDNPTPLKIWASDPDSTHVAYTDDPALLNRIFLEIGADIVEAGAQDVRILEELTPDFKIVRVNVPTLGTVQVTGQQTLNWAIDAAGLTARPETVSLSFDIMHIGTSGGVKAVNRSLAYHDRAENILEFPSPTVTVNCHGTVIFPEPCPVPAEFQTDHCKDAAIVHLPDAQLQSLGRIVQADVTIRSVCPGKRVAAAIMLTEIGPNGEEYSRGIKVVTIPALSGTRCQDVILRCIRFVVPEALDMTGAPDSLCNTRNFGIRVMANYLDTDFVCCDADTVIL